MTDRDRDKSVEQWLRQTPVAGARVDDCLDAETLAAWSEGLLDGRARSTAEAHAASCARCQAMLAIMVRTTPARAGATRSPLRKWLVMLSPAMAAAAAVALWVAVGQRPAPSVIDELTKGVAKSERVAEVTQAAPAPAVGAEKEVDRKAADSLDRDAPKVTADARRESGSRTRTGGPADARATAPGNERTEKKDVASASRADKSRDAELRAAAVPAAPAPPPPTPAPPAARPSPAEGVTSSAASPPVMVPPPGPAPLQQANQAPNQNPNQAQTQSQNQAGQRQQAGAQEERVIVTGEQPLVRTAADNAARAGSGGRGGATGAFADASALKFRANAGTFDIAVPASSIRWRIPDGRTIQRSLDSGVTWANHHAAENDMTLTAGAAPTPNVCWLVGRSGAIILTIDGRAWRRIKFPEPLDLAAVTASDARTATVTTADGRQFATTDGGRTWTLR
jgi:Photosynthesis system II assembly factor YCF48